MITRGFLICFALSLAVAVTPVDAADSHTKMLVRPSPLKSGIDRPAATPVCNMRGAAATCASFRPVASRASRADRVAAGY
jgi:hypothetical protein